MIPKDNARVCVMSTMVRWLSLCSYWSDRSCEAAQFGILTRTVSERYECRKSDVHSKDVWNFVLASSES